MQHIALFLGLSLLCEAGICAPAPEGAIQAVASYSEAFNSGDCQTALALLSPRERRNIARDQGGDLGFCKILGAFHAAGVIDRVRAPTASLAHGPYRMVVVPNSRYGVVDAQSPAVTEGAYVVHSSDSGRTWHVLDLACVDARWVKDAYPPYNGRPKIGPATVEVLSRVP
jgi:hypothetical protein